MKRSSSCMIAASLLVLASPVVAQQVPAPTTQSPMRTVRAPTPPSSSWVMAEYEALLDSASGNNLPAQPLQRVDLANRVSTLIELGRCGEARDEAREAGDRQMALRARQLCRADRSPAS